ncbi:MAG: hypothetical protein OEV64_06475 [Desulfobulbaceae bacterium]|nr:hypothetical protein [Desulfobulbaceae bacterium]
MGRGNDEQKGDWNRPVSDETVFKVVKEIVVKFIEVGRLTPTNFEETYDKVYEVVKRSVKEGE